MPRSAVPIEWRERDNGDERDQRESFCAIGITRACFKRGSVRCLGVGRRSHRDNLKDRLPKILRWPVKSAATPE